MNINDKITLLHHFKYILPMIVCAICVIISQGKIIGKTLKAWWNWGFDLLNWTSEKTNYLLMLIAFVITFVICFSPPYHQKREELATKQQEELIVKSIEDKVMNEWELIKFQQSKNLKENSSFQKNSLPFYSISPLFCFLAICIFAPIIEECVFRYLIFENFGKKNPFTFLFSGVSFIFAHWQTSLLNFTTINYLLLNHLPMTTLFIWVYWKSKWNITYPIFFHMLWNTTVFFASILLSK